MRLKSSRQPLDLVTGLDTYPNMVITSYEIDRNVENGFDLPFEMSFKQIRIVKSETTTITAFTPSADQVAGSSNMGVAGTKKVDPESNYMREAWRTMYRNSGGKLPTKEEFYKNWGVYP